MATSKHTHTHAECSHASVGLAQACPNCSWKPKDTEVMVKNPLLLVWAIHHLRFCMCKNGSETEQNPQSLDDTIRSTIYALILNNQLLNHCMTVLWKRNGTFFESLYDCTMKTER